MPLCAFPFPVTHPPKTRAKESVVLRERVYWPRRLHRGRSACATAAAPRAQVKWRRPYKTQSSMAAAILPSFPYFRLPKMHCKDGFYQQRAPAPRQFPTRIELPKFTFIFIITNKDCFWRILTCWIRLRAQILQITVR